MSASLPDIHLKDIGKDKGGATPSEVAGKLLSALDARDICYGATTFGRPGSLKFLVSRVAAVQTFVS